VRPSTAVRPAYEDLTTDIMTRGAEVAPAVPEGGAARVAASVKRISATGMTISAQQAAITLDDASEEKKHEIEDGKIHRLLRRRSVEYLLQGAGAIIGGVQDKGLAAALQGESSDSIADVTENSLKDLHLGYTHKQEIAQERRQREKGELEEGGLRGLEQSHLKHADDYKGAKGFKYGPGGAANHVKGVDKDSIATVAGMVREIYTSRGKNYKVSTISPRRAALLLRWVNISTSSPYL